MLDVIKKDDTVKKIRTNYKYEQGAAQFYKDNNYANNYYNTRRRLDVPFVIPLL